MSIKSQEDFLKKFWQKVNITFLESPIFYMIVIHVDLTFIAYHKVYNVRSIFRVAKLRYSKISISWIDCHKIRNT